VRYRRNPLNGVVIEFNDVLATRRDESERKMEGESIEEDNARGRWAAAKTIDVSDE